MLLVPDIFLLFSSQVPYHQCRDAAQCPTGIIVDKEQTPSLSSIWFLTMGEGFYLSGPIEDFLMYYIM